MLRDQALVANRQAPVPCQPRHRALDHPAVTPQSVLRLLPFARDPVLHVAPAAGVAAAPIVVALVRMQLVGPMAGPAPASRPERRDRIQHGLQHAAVVDVGGGHLAREGNPGPVDHNMLLRARFALIRRVGSGLRAPLFAARLRESTAARLQSMRSAAANRSSRTRCSRFHTPRRCHWRSRRQHVTPLPHPIACGKYSQGMPVCSTKRMPVSAARCGTGGRPPFRLRRCLGSNGSMTVHSSSVTSAFIRHLHLRRLAES